jgi:hypothetical protein
MLLFALQFILLPPFVVMVLVWHIFSFIYMLNVIDFLAENTYNICGKYEDGIPFLQRKENLP